MGSRVELTPEEALLAAALRRAIRDAKEASSECVRTEAAQWLWTVAPSIAHRANVPQLSGTDALPMGQNHAT